MKPTSTGLLPLAHRCPPRSPSPSHCLFDSKPGAPTWPSQHPSLSRANSTSCMHEKQLQPCSPCCLPMPTQHACETHDRRALIRELRLPAKAAPLSYTPLHIARHLQQTAMACPQPCTQSTSPHVSCQSHDPTDFTAAFWFLQRHRRSK